MDPVSSSFQFALIDDGSQLSYDLTSDGTISQTWNNGVPAPNFETTRPTMYIVLRNGASYAAVSNTYTWKYNGQVLEFDANDLSVTPAGVFKKTTKTVGGLSMPALQILKNLMTSPTSVVDVVRFEGKYILQDGSDVDIVDEYQIPLTESKDGTAYKGVLTGKTYLENADDSTNIVAQLWNPQGNVETSAYVTWWSIDDGEHWTSRSNSQGTPPTYPVTAADVQDKASLICEFWPVGTSTSVHPATGVPLTTEVIDIDDVSDPFEMVINSVQAKSSEIQSATGFGTGDRASLRREESVKIQCYGVRSAGSKLPSDALAFTHAYCYVRDYNKQFFDGTLEGFNSPTVGHWRAVSLDSNAHIATQILSAAAAAVCGGSGEIRFTLRTNPMSNS